MVSNVSGINQSVGKTQYRNYQASSNHVNNNHVSFGVDPFAVSLIGVGAGVVSATLTQFANRYLERSRTLSVVVKHLEENNLQTAANWLRNKYDRSIRPDKVFGRFAKEKILYAKSDHPVYMKKFIHRLTRRLQRAGHMDAAQNITNQFAYTQLQHQNFHG